MMRILCLILCVLSCLAGGLGMAASFLFLASTSPNENTAGAAGFVAGSILSAAGLISLTLLATREAPGPEDQGQQTKESLLAGTAHGRRESSGFRDG